MSTVFDINTSSCETHNKAMSPDQFDQVVRAILEGKYSWACVLILRFAGYNPAHYIPYRTYKRLVKNHRLDQTSPSPTAASELKTLKQSSISVY